MTQPSLSDIRALTFDCFGTLIDWPCGILSVLRPMAEAHGLHQTDAELLSSYARHEREVEAGEYRSYRCVLGEVIRRMFGPTANQEALARAVGSWRPFPDTVEGLRRLKGRFRLGVLSNIDDDLFEPVLDTLGRSFEVVVTAEQVKSYKPGEAHFREGLARLGLKAHEVLHAAESRFHDIEPAGRLGFRTVWINRGLSAASPGGGKPDWTVRSVAELVSLLGL